MIRLAPSLVVLLSVSLVSAQENDAGNQPLRERKTAMPVEEYAEVLRTQLEHLETKWGESPASLAEAHTRLEHILSAETLAKIDAMDSEDGMIQYHFGFGLSMRNAWGLWRRDSSLARHMMKLGFTNGDEVSGAILATFWCKRHGQDFRLEERAARYEKLREEEENRVPRARAALQSRLMRLRFEKGDVPVVPIAVRNERGLRVRSLYPFHDGVFLTAYRRGHLRRVYVSMQESYVDPNGDSRPTSQYDDFVHRGYGFDETEREIRKMKPGEDFRTEGYYFDPADRRMHRVGVPEVNEVYGAVVAGERAWFGGVTNGELVVVGVSDHDRLTVPLPQDDEMPDLGVDGASLLAVYKKTIYRLEDRTWTVVHSGDVLLPRSSLPPQRYGNTVFFREEEEMGGRQVYRLWWLTMAQPPHLSVLDRRLRVITAGVLGLREVTSWCLTDQGDLWVCTGEHYLGNCLLRRSRDGSFAIATVGSSVQLAEDWPDLRQKYQGAAVSAVRALSDNGLLLAGRTGLYRLEDNELVQELAFSLDRPLVEVKARDRVVDHVTWRRKDGKMVKEVTKVVQKAPEERRQVVSSVPWLPTSVLQLEDGAYFIGSDTWEGAYLICQGDDGQWIAQAIAEGDSVVW